MARPSSTAVSSASSTLWSPDHLRKLKMRTDDEDAGDLPRLTKGDMIGKQKQFLNSARQQEGFGATSGGSARASASAAAATSQGTSRSAHQLPKGGSAHHPHSSSAGTFVSPPPVGSSVRRNNKGDNHSLGSTTPSTAASSISATRATPSSLASRDSLLLTTSPPSTTTSSDAVPWTRSASNPLSTTSGSSRYDDNHRSSNSNSNSNAPSFATRITSTTTSRTFDDSDYDDDDDYTYRRPRSRLATNVSQRRGATATASASSSSSSSSAGGAPPPRSEGSGNHSSNNTHVTPPSTAPPAASTPSLSASSFDLNKILCFPSTLFQFAASEASPPDALPLENGSSTSNNDRLAGSNNSHGMINNSILSDGDVKRDAGGTSHNMGGTPPLPPPPPPPPGPPSRPSPPPSSSNNSNGGSKPPPSPLRRLFHAAVASAGGTPPRFGGGFGNRPRASSFDGATGTKVTPPSVTAPFSKQQLVVLDDLQHLLAGRSSEDAFEFLQHMVVDLMREVDTTNDILDEEMEKWAKREQYWVQQRGDIADCVVAALENHGGGDANAKARRRLLHQLAPSSNNSSAPPKISMSAKPIVEATDLVLDHLASQVSHLQKENDELKEVVKRQQASLDDLNGIAETRGFKIEALEQQFVALNASRGSLAKKLVDRTNQMIKLQFGGVPRVVNVHTNSGDDNVEVHQVEDEEEEGPTTTIPALVEDDEDDDHDGGAYGARHQLELEEDPLDNDDHLGHHHQHSVARQPAPPFRKVVATASLASTASCPEGSSLSVD